MATQTITAPAVIKIENKSAEARVFAPYKESFKVSLPASAVIELQVKTSGQIFYYLKQAKEDLKVSVLADFDQTVGAIKIHAKETVTLTNNLNRVVSFVPYKENFQYDVAAGDVVTITAENVGQTLYYLAQKDLTVTHAEQQ